MLAYRLIDGNTVREHLERDGYVDIEGEISLDGLNHLSETMGISSRMISVSCGAGEKLRIHVPKSD